MNFRVIEKNTKIAERILFKILESVGPGASTYDINDMVKYELGQYEALSAARSLGSRYYISVSIDEEVVFGEISKKKVIKEGDVVKLALGVFKNGYFSDTGLTVGVGRVPEEKKRLINGTAKALEEAVSQLHVDVTVGGISSAIENILNGYNLNPVYEIMGHGIGRNLHELPVIPNRSGLPLVDYGIKFTEGGVVCIEPIATTGNGEVTRKDKMRFITKDKKPSAHFEFPVLVKKNGPEILAKELYDYIKDLSE